MPLEAKFLKVGYSYEDMFTSLFNAMPGGFKIEKALGWAKRVLRKQDRIIWYLRWYRLNVSVVLGRGLDDKDREKVELLRDKYVNEINQKRAASGLPQIDPTDKAFMYNVDLNEMEHLLSLPIPQIQNKVFGYETPEEIFQEFEEYERDYKDKAGRIINPKPTDEIWLNFPDGTAWVNLHQAACTEEARAMGHCGNQPQSENQHETILSLRIPKFVGGQQAWEPYLTFILHDNGYLGEMKGRGNSKPAPRYHPYIIKLLEDPRIVGIAGGGYAPDKNFSLKDLPEAEQERLVKLKPGLISLLDYYYKFGVDKFLLKQIQGTLNIQSKLYDPKTKSYVVASWPTLREVVLEKDEYGMAEKALEYVQPTPSLEDIFDIVYSGSYTQKHETVFLNMGVSTMYQFPQDWESYIRDWVPEERKDERPVLPYNTHDDVYVLTGFLRELAKKYLGISDEEKRISISSLGKIKWSKVPVLEDLKNAWFMAKPNEDAVRDSIIEHAMLRINPYSLELRFQDKIGLNQPVNLVLPMIGACAYAQEFLASGNSRDEDWISEMLSTFRLSIPFEDNLDIDVGVEYLAQKYFKPPVRPPKAPKKSRLTQRGLLKYKVV